MSRRVISTGKWCFICTYVVLLQFAAVISMMETENGTFTPMELPDTLTSLCTVPGGVNIPVHLVLDKSSSTIKYNLLDESHDFVFHEKEMFMGLTSIGTIAFEDLECSIETARSGIQRWQFKSKNGQVNKELITFPTPNYTIACLLEVFSRENSELLYNSVVTTEENVADPNRFYLKLHPDYSYPGFEFPVKLIVKIDSECSGVRVTTTRYNEMAELTLERIQGIEVYEMDNFNGILRKQYFVVQQIPNTEKFRSLGWENSTAEPSKLPQCLVDDSDSLVEHFFDFEVNSNISFFRKGFSLESENARTTVETLLETQMVLATASRWFNTFIYNPLAEVEIIPIQDRTFGIKPRECFRALEIFKRGTNGELILVTKDELIYYFGESPNIVAKIETVAADKVQYYESHSIFRLNLSQDRSVTIKVQKIVPNKDSSQNVYFTQTILPIQYRAPVLLENDQFLCAYEDGRLTWRAIFEVTSHGSKANQLMLKARNFPNQTISKNIASFTFRLSQAGDVRIIDHQDNIFTAELLPKPGMKRNSIFLSREFSLRNLFNCDPKP